MKRKAKLTQTVGWNNTGIEEVVADTELEVEDNIFDSNNKKANNKEEENVVCYS